MHLLYCQWMIDISDACNFFFAIEDLCRNISALEYLDMFNDNNGGKNQRKYKATFTEWQYNESPKHSTSNARTATEVTAESNGSTCCNFDVILMRWKNISTYIVLSDKRGFRIWFHFDTGIKTHANKQSIKLCVHYALRFYTFWLWVSGFYQHDTKEQCTFYYYWWAYTTMRTCVTWAFLRQTIFHMVYNRIHWVLDCCFQFIQWIDWRTAAASYINIHVTNETKS